MDVERSGSRDGYKGLNNGKFQDHATTISTDDILEILEIPAPVNHTVTDILDEV